MTLFCDSPRYEVYSTSMDGSECITLPVYFREKKSRLSSTSSGAVLYGQPLLVSVPKHKLTLESLYQAVCDRIRLVPEVQFGYYLGLMGPATLVLCNISVDPMFSSL